MPVKEVSPFNLFVAHVVCSLDEKIFTQVTNEETLFGLGSLILFNRAICSYFCSCWLC